MSSTSCLLRNRKGLKYPDEYFTKFFFKTGLSQYENKTFLEFGCGNGNNLLLPYEFGNQVIGIDFNPVLIEHAEDNFSDINSDTQYDFYSEDMRSSVTKHKNIRADVLMLPSVACYISKKDFIEFLVGIKKNNLLKESIPFYIRLRTPKDYRYGLGDKVEYNTYVMPKQSGTNENGALMIFYEPWELIDLLREYLDLRDFKSFCLDCQNEQEGKVILNSDIVVWGIVN